MKVMPSAGKPADASSLVNVPRLVTAYYAEIPDHSAPEERVAFGTSGHRGSSLTRTFNERHGSGAAIGGLKVATENAWFAARPSGTEAIYKIYAESFRGPSHLARVLEEARSLVTETLAPGAHRVDTHGRDEGEGRR